MNRLSALMVATLVMTLPLATGEDQTVEGQIILGSPTNATGDGVLTPPDGITGVWIQLKTIANGNDEAWLFFNGTGTLVDVDVKWYDGNQNRISSNRCATEANPEHCVVPTSSAYANVVAISGVDITFNFTYKYTLS